MTIEFRTITADEGKDYLRVLPYVNGLPQEEPRPSAWYAGFATWPPQRPPASEEQLDRYAESLKADWFRPQAAFVDGKLVGASAIVSVELTIPGWRQVPMGGVTSTAVLATHRRRGLLRGMMTAMLTDCRERGEFLVGLSASEGSIYGRYGFSPATFQERWELSRSEARFREPIVDTGELELVDPATAAGIWPDLHERTRARRVGEVSPLPGKWDGLPANALPADGSGAAHHLIHRNALGEVDAAAIFRLPWSPDPALAGALQVEAFEAGSLEAYRAMWGLLTDFDLTNRVVAARRPVDEPLRWMLADHRALRVTRARDNLWLRVLDVRAALETRAYAVPGSVVLDVTDELCPWNAGRWRLEAGPDGAACTPAPEQAPDLGLSTTELGSLYLGGVSPAVLVAAGRVVEHSPGAADQLGQMLRVGTAPHNAVGF